ncbi:exodeoxyribonuclease III [Algihabitans albus]|uniref:exodeoxyribonuclease III n=1 Tax=Algihabitans albus TaxID=2164067 RepID=UPI001F18CBF5|nr:exodeoxyribonuclease III [Algihabitans albus]
MPLRVATWNVNSLRQRLDHLARLDQAQRPDVLCLQETKVADGSFPENDIKALGYDELLICGQKSYNGVAIASRRPVEAQGRQIWCGKDDKRHLWARVSGVDIHCFYVPSGGTIPDPERNDKFAHKLAFLGEMKQWAAAEAKGRPLLLLGDLNVAPLEKDVWNHKKLLRSVGHTPGESAAMSGVIEAGHFIDIARHFVPETEPLYTWWGYRFPAAFEKDYGWRLDHAWATESLGKRLEKLTIIKETRTWERPSDHVPVIVDIAE